MKVCAIRTYRNELERVSRYLRRWSKGSHYGKSVTYGGLCVNLNMKFGCRMSRFIMSDVGHWSDFSGSYNYPVVAKVEDCEWDSHVFKPTNPKANDIYNAINPKHFWDDSAYGKKRKEMCGWLADANDEYIRLMDKLGWEGHIETVNYYYLRNK